MQRGSGGRDRFMHCKNPVWSPGSQTKDGEVKEEKCKYGRTDFRFYVNKWRDDHLENKKEWE